MAIRYSFDETKKIVESNSECKLLDCWYAKGHKQLKLQCSCGEIFCTNWRAFTRKDTTPIRMCEKCRKKNKSKYIGKIVGDFLITGSWNENGDTVYEAKCIHCGSEVLGRRTIIDHGSCDCQKSIRQCDNDTRLGKIYHGMLNRCENANNTKYHDYGGRGIQVCDEWKTFPPFKRWALENGYSDELSIDRIDVNGNYEPSNCRWVTNRVQCLNKRNNHYVTYNGRTQTIQEWGEELNIKPNTLIYRLRRGWDIEKTLTTPLIKN